MSRSVLLALARTIQQRSSSWSPHLSAALSTAARRPRQQPHQPRVPLSFAMPNTRGVKRSRDEDDEKVSVIEDKGNWDADKAAASPRPTTSSSASSAPSSKAPTAVLAPATADLAAYQLQWQRFGTLLVLDSHSSATARIPGSSRVAAFDMDSTLIAPKSGRRFPLHRGDWRWLHPEVPLKLKQLHRDGWKLVVFTNQNGISTGQTTAATITGKISDLIAHLGCPVQVFVATADDLFRKPATNMWAKFVHDHNDAVAVDLQASMYVGDAAGRQRGWDGNAATKKDHSAADRKFALNVGIRFATPEPYFLGHKEAEYKLDSLDIASFFTKPASKRQKTEEREVEEAASEGEDQVAEDEDEVKEEEKAGEKVVGSAASTSTSSKASVTGVPSSSSASSSTDTASTDAATTTVPSSDPSASTSSSSTPLHARSHQELVLFVGFPASGKSTYARKHFVPHGYTHINQDTMKTKEKCVKQAGLALAQHHSVVVDNTNPAADTRALYIKLAKQHRVPVRCYVFNTPLELAKHLNMYREKLTGGAHKHVPRIAYNMYNKNWRRPAKSEGIDEIVEVDFVPHFDTDKERQLFEQRS